MNFGRSTSWRAERSGDEAQPKGRLVLACELPEGALLSGRDEPVQAVERTVTYRRRYGRWRGTGRLQDVSPEEVERARRWIVERLNEKMAEVWHTEYDKDLIVAKARELAIWKEIGYEPTIGKYNSTVWMPEHVYAEQVLLYLVNRAKERLAPNCPPMSVLYDLAASEYFMLEDGVIGQVTRVRLRLNGKGSKVPDVNDYRTTIRQFLQAGGLPDSDG